MVFSFLLSILISAGIKKLINSNNNTVKLPETRGGEFIDKRVDPNSVYEVVDSGLEVVIKRMLKVPLTAGPIIISAPVLFLAYIVSRQPVQQVTILGVDFILDQAKNTMIKTALGALGGWATMYGTTVLASAGLGMASVSGVILAIAIGGAAMNHRANSMNCDHFLSKVVMQQTAPQQTAGFLDLPNEKHPKIYIKGNEDIPLYRPSSTKNKSCSSVPVPQQKLRGHPSDPSTLHIERSIEIEQKYVPLKHRTKTLKDLKKEDSTEIREIGQPYIKRYEARRQRIKNNRNNNEL